MVLVGQTTADLHALGYLSMGIAARVVDIAEQLQIIAAPDGKTLILHFQHTLMKFLVNLGLETVRSLRRWKSVKT